MERNANETPEQYLSRLVTENKNLVIEIHTTAKQYGYKYNEKSNTFTPKPSIPKIIAYTTLATIIGAYAIGFAADQKKLSEGIEPLRQEFEKTVDKKENRDFTFNYGGRLEEIAAAKNKFAHDNNAIPKAWKAVITTLDDKAVPETPTPKRYNPLHWEKVNTHAVNAYLKQHGKGHKNYK